jgi:hypothetical protein
LVQQQIEAMEACSEWFFNKCLTIHSYFASQPSQVHRWKPQIPTYIPIPRRNLQAIQEHQVLMVVAETRSGKMTQLPLAVFARKILFVIVTTHLLITKLRVFWLYYNITWLWLSVFEKEYFNIIL